MCLQYYQEMEGSSYQYTSMIRGYHEYQSIWTPQINEELLCARDVRNPHDPYAVSVKKGQNLQVVSPSIKTSTRTSNFQNLFIQIRINVLSFFLINIKQYKQLKVATMITIVLLSYTRGFAHGCTSWLFEENFLQKWFAHSNDLYY